MIPLILTIITAITYYSIAKKSGASRVKWTIIGVLVAIVPLVLFPALIIGLTGRPDLDGLSLMAAILFVMVFGSIISKRITPK